MTAAGKFTFPRMIAPAFLNFSAIVESLGTFAPRRAKEPAVLFIKSLVAMLFLISTGYINMSAAVTGTISTS